MSDPATATAVGAAAGTDARIEVDHIEGEAFDIRVRGHRVRVDQPVEHGGRDQAPTPTELSVASHCTVHNSVTVSPKIAVTVD